MVNCSSFANDFTYANIENILASLSLYFFLPCSTCIACSTWSIPTTFPSFLMYRGKPAIYLGNSFSVTPKNFAKASSPPKFSSSNSLPSSTKISAGLFSNISLYIALSASLIANCSPAVATVTIRARGNSNFFIPNPLV